MQPRKRQSTADQPTLAQSTLAQSTLAQSTLAQSTAGRPDAVQPRTVQPDAVQARAARDVRLDRIRAAGRRRAHDESRRFWESVHTQRLDAGLSQVRLAHAAGISTAYLCQLEAGDREATLDVCAQVAAVLGGEASLRYFPAAGPRLRDHLQASMLEGFLPFVHRRWGRRLEVPISSPVRGYIDLVLDERAARLSVAAEFQSDLRRLEQQLRWAQAKADALLPLDRMTPWATSRLLVLRSTVRTRHLVATHAELMRTAFPASIKATIAALTTDSAPWPGSALLWMRLERGVSMLLDRPPRGIQVGR